MEEKLNFSLPKEKKRNSVLMMILIVLLFLLLSLTVINLLVGLRAQRSMPGTSAASSGLSVEQTKQLATKLAQRNLYRQAAEVWQDYLSASKLTDTERARTLFQIATLLEKAGSYDKAIEYYYRSETVAKLDNLAGEINTHIKDCFERLGKFSALRYELMDRTSLEGSGNAGGKIVAEIGAEKITEADLDGVIENNIDHQLQPMAAFMTPEQLNEQKKKMLEQFKSPEAKKQFLQAYLAQEILYREALAEGLAEKPEVKKLIDDVAHSVLSQQLMNQELAAKINITDGDLQTYYTANKDKYMEPGGAKISHILVADEQQANNLIDRIKNGEDFGKLAKEFSTDESTKEKGGKIDIEAREGSYVPVIGDNEELNKKIFAAKAPTVLDEPLKTEKGWEIVKVEERTDKRQKSFDEVREQVMSAILSQKRQDVQQDYIKQMMDKYNVIIHTSALTGTTQQKEAEEKSTEAVK